MVSTTEIIVLIMYSAGFPLCIVLFKGAKLPGAMLFLLAYTSLLLSNIFTVLEGFCLASLFDFLEHFFVTTGAFCIFFAVRELIQKRREYPTEYSS